MRVRESVHRTAYATGIGRLARRVFRKRPLVLCYHATCEGSTPDVPDPEGMQVPARLFEEQMQFVLRHYTPVTLQQVGEHFAGRGALPSRALLVTFDDGYRNVVRNALPILKRLGIPCAMFLVTDLVGTERSIWTAELEWWRGTDRHLRELKRRLKAMSQVDRAEALRSLVPSDARLPECDTSLCTWEEMRSWIGPDVSVGSHGLTHEPLTTCDDASLERELEQSRGTIQKQLGVPIEALAYPNGDHTPEVIEVAARCGYSLAFSTAPRHVRAGEGPLSVPRILVGREDQISVFASRLSGWIEWIRSD